MRRQNNVTKSAHPANVEVDVDVTSSEAYSNNIDGTIYMSTIFNFLNGHNANSNFTNNIGPPIKSVSKNCYQSVSIL